MMSYDEAERRLSALPSIQVTRNEPLSRHTRLGLGGPAAVWAETGDEATFVEALRWLQTAGLPWLVMGCGTNLIVADRGYRGVVLRYTGARMAAGGETIRAQAGATLQAVVDLSTASGLAGMETLTGIPGNLGAAIYGNAGAYGASIADLVRRVRYFDGERIREADGDACGFRYRGSVFKQRRLAGQAWLILSAELGLRRGAAEALQARAAEILAMRNLKYPPEMRCAGSTFKNLILAELPAEVQAQVPGSVVKGGKVPSAWLLEQTGAKGLADGGIRVTDYHANTIYNTGSGTAAQYVELAAELKRRVRVRSGIELEEEVQAVGFDQRLAGLDHLETTPFALQALLVGLTPEELHACPEAGRWSIAQVVAHLVHAERHHFRARLEGGRAPYRAETPEPLFALAALEEFLVERRLTLAELSGGDGSVEDALPLPCGRGSETGWAGCDSAEGSGGFMTSPTLAELVREWAAHDLTHLGQIAGLVRSVKYYPDAASSAPSGQTQLL